MVHQCKSSKVGYGLEIDIWAAGVVLYSMIYGRFPFSNKRKEQTLEEIKNGNVHCDKSASSNVRDLILQMLSEKKERISIEGILKHPRL